MDVYLVLLFLATTVALPLETSTSSECKVTEDDQNRPVSCEPCNTGQYEVHVRNVATGYTGTATVAISLRSGVSPRSVRLLLISKVHLKWVLKASTNLVDIDKVVTMSSDGLNSTLTYPTEFKLLKPTHVHKDTSSMTRDPSQVANLLRQKGLGEMTSYKADFSGQADFDIMLGACDTVKFNRKLTNKELQCLSNPQCLIKARFGYNKDRTECTGESYITKYANLFVGIVLCTSNRYKLYMSNLLEGPYLDIADRVPFSNYYGTDHCQVVGQNDESVSKTSHTFSPSLGCPSAYGFYREYPNQNFLFGKICGGDHDLATYTGRKSPSWYECGNVRFPGNFVIVNASWLDTLPTPAVPTHAGSTMQGPQTSLVTIIIPVVLGVIVSLVILALAVVFYRRRKQQRRERQTSGPRRGSRDLLQDNEIGMAVRPAPQRPPEATQVIEGSEGEYCYAGFNEPPRHTPKPPSDPDVKPVSELQKPHPASVPNVYTTEPDRLRTNVPNNTVPKLLMVPTIQTMPDVDMGTEYANSPNTEADTPGLLNVPKNPNIPSAPNTPTPQKKPSPLVAKKPFVPKSPAMPQKNFIPASPKFIKQLISPQTHDVSETGIVVTAANNVVPRGFLTELEARLPTRADKTVKEGSTYDNIVLKFVGDDEEEEYLEIINTS